MTITTTDTVERYVGDGSQTAWPITFPFFKGEDVKACIVNGAGEQVNLVYGTDYTVTKSTSSIGGIVHYALADGVELTIWLNLPITQPTDFYNTGPLNAEVLEDAFDRLTLIAQQLLEASGRSIKVENSSTATPEELLASLYAGRDAAVASASAAATSESNAAASKQAAAGTAASVASSLESAVTAAVNDATASATASASAAATSATNAATSEQAAASSAITAQTWAESETPPDPDDAESKSAKAWALSAAANVPFASTTYAGKVMASTSLYVNQETGEATVPAASETLAGIARQATNAEAAAGTVNGAVFVKPSHLAALNAFRLSRIGVPVPVASSTLDDSFKLADGSLVLFADYPELHARYVAQKLLVLSSTVSTASKASHPLYFVLNANNTGLYLPRLSGLFMRAWVGTSSGSTGGHNSAGLPNITGTIENLVSTTSEGGTSPNGAFAWTYAADVNPGRIVATPDVAWKFNPQFKASQSNSIYGQSTTVMPESYNQPIAIYLGQPA